MMKKLLIASLLAGSFGAVSLPALAEVVVVRQAPPALREERRPAARHGYAWAPGHWIWRNNHYVWNKGMYVRERRGYHYNAPAWQERDGRWEMQRGGWARGDRDHDGVPNGADRAPNNPNRR
jgi:hypothetical protein